MTADEAVLPQQAGKPHTISIMIVIVIIVIIIGTCTCCYR